MKIIIIGGSTSGTICAWELRKLNKEHEITIVEESSSFQYSPCAMPYVISGEISREKIILLSKQDYDDNNISILNNTYVKKINPNQNEIIIESNNTEKTINYDVLVLAMGSVPVNPGILINTNKYSFFKTIDDMDKIIAETKNEENITIAGAGFIGIETAHALNLLNKNVTIVEAKNQILPLMLDVDMSLIIEEELKNKGINILKEEFVKEINENSVLTNKQEIKTNYTIISVGMMPKIELAKDANIEISKGIITNDYQQTNFKNIYACGDCAEIKCVITNKSITTGLANTAFAQGKSVARNILNMSEKTEHTLKSSISKIGDVYVGSTGLNLYEAKEVYENVMFAKHSTYTTAQYYSTKNIITVKLLADDKGFILGAQMISKENISGYLNLINMAIKLKINLNELAKLETPYNPASNPLNDPLITTAKILLKKLNFLNK